MSTLFFYENFTKFEMLKQIDNDFTISDGYVLIKNYDKNTNVLEIGNALSNNYILQGKLVSFKMSLNSVLNKINNIDDCKFKNKNESYKVERILAKNDLGESLSTYIIY